jgi:hypothetical protein
MSNSAKAKNEAQYKDRPIFQQNTLQLRRKLH